MLKELRSAVRGLRRSPGFTTLAVLTFALAIGATTAVFSVVQAIVLRPLPYAEPDRLADVSHMTKEGRRLLTSLFDLPDLRAMSDIFEDVAGRNSSVLETVLTSAEGEAHPVSGLGVTHNYFSVLGVRPAIGRSFAPEDAIPTAQPAEGDAPDPGMAAVVTHDFWRRLTGGDADLAAHALYFRGRPLRVVGVLPPGFRLLHERKHRWVRGTNVDLFLVLNEAALSRGRPEGYQGRWFLQLGRLREGVTYARAQAALDALAARYREEIPFYADDELELPLHPLHEDLKQDSEAILLLMGGGVAFLMLLACANVAGLMLVRGRVTAGEDAVRAALGSGRVRLVTRRLQESLVLGIAGSAGGLAVAWLAVQGVEMFAPRRIPLLDRVSLDWAALLFATALTLAASALAGLLPALQAWGTDLTRPLKLDSRTGSAGGRQRLMKALVIGELALSTVLLSGALVMARSMVALTQSDPGFDPRGLMTFDVVMIDGRRRNVDEREATYGEIERRLAALPGVLSIGRTSMPPLSEVVANENYGWTPEVVERRVHRAELSTASRSYFATMGTRLLVGRNFDARDEGPQSDAAIVDEEIARRAWPDEDPIGKPIYIGSMQRTVVGVVEPMLMRDYGNVRNATIYFPEWRVGAAGTFVLRTEGGSGNLADRISRMVAAVDPGVKAHKLQSLSDRVAVARAPMRFLLLTAGFFAAAALAVAASGLFGVIAYTVRSRTTEMGIRIAVGAQPRDLVRMVLGQGIVLAIVGLVVGLAGTWMLSDALAAAAYEVSPRDPALLGATGAVLVVVTLLACLVPAWWATRVDPVEALGS